ncbi:fibulin-5-like [Montipora capricornis]|uniref:fibulin-5-like n=1 Tax=Montipora capricornis TaxID=246305 RepID=UPI0035F17639
MKPFGFTTFGKACLLILIIVLLYAVATEIGCKPSISEEKAGKVFSRGETHTGVRYANFKEDKFSYLNITILGYSHVDRTPQCSLACLETPTCFSYNLAAKPDINGKLLCELLPSDKYNNSDKFVSNEFFHHFSIASPCSGWPCKNDGTCLALYEENSYKCICNAGFTGRDCKNDIDECSSENECHVNATCMNTMGSYTCTCNSGYQGDGRNCADIDECSSENECHVNATCTNTIGSYNCTCKKGYVGDGRNCSDIDECSSENECHVNATCRNTIGSYICTCKKGKEGDGRNCSGKLKANKGTIATADADSFILHALRAHYSLDVLRSNEKERSQSGYTGREEPKGKFEVNEVLSIRKSSPSLTRDGGYLLFTAHKNGHVF